MIKLAVFLALFLTVSCGTPPAPVEPVGVNLPKAEDQPPFSRDTEAVAINQKKDRVREFFSPMGKPTEHEWLYTMEEAGQTFPEYVNANPTRITEQRRVIYILPAGRFSAAETQVIERVEKYMRIFFGVDVKTLKRMGLDGVPAARKRKNPFDGSPQVQTGWFLDEALPPRLPDDCAALICLTSTDLYPGDKWNFVFGQANLSTRVGVYSFARLGKASGKEQERRRFLERALKISMHETGHMFSIQHCKAYVCIMSGSMGLHETDAQPLDACPECSAKIWWAFKNDPADRYRRLAEFYREVGWDAEVRKFEEKAARIDGR